MRPLHFFIQLPLILLPSGNPLYLVALENNRELLCHSLNREYLKKQEVPEVAKSVKAGGNHPKSVKAGGNPEVTDFGYL